MTLEDRQQVEIKRLWAEKAGLREGVVTAVSPLEISIGGSDVSVRAVAGDGVALEVDDRVSVLIQDQRIPLVVARPTDDPQNAAGGGVPSGSAGGDLSGTYPNPQIATGAIVNADVSASAAIQQSKISGLTTDLAAKAPLASPALTGNPTAPTQSASNDSTRLATTAFVKDQKVTDLTPPTTAVDFNGQQATNAADATASDSLVTKGQMELADLAVQSGYRRMTDVDRAPYFIATGASEPWVVPDVLDSVFGYTRTGNVLDSDINGALYLNDLTTVASSLSGDPGDIAALGMTILLGAEWGANPHPDWGIYEVTAVGGVSSKWQLTRRSDADTTGDIQQFSLVRSKASGAMFYQATPGTITMNSTSQEWLAYKFFPAEHASSHAPSGTDPLLTGTPVAVGTANAEGSADSFARSDHVHAPPAVQSWIEVGSGGSAPAFSNSWVNYGGSYGNIGFYKDPLGVVHLKGVMKTGTLNSAAFQLPAGYRPAANLEIATVSTDAVTWIRSHVTVGSSGNVVPRPGGNTWFSLDGISFRAA